MVYKDRQFAELDVCGSRTRGVALAVIPVRRPSRPSSRTPAPTQNGSSADGLVGRPVPLQLVCGSLAGPGARPAVRVPPARLVPGERLRTQEATADGAGL